jgi:hypothetical protein
MGALGYAVGDISEGTPKWIHEEVDGYTNDQGLDEGDRGKFTDLAIGTDGRVWISYYDVGLKYLRYATKDPSSGEWTAALADSGGGSSPDAGLFTSIALDANESPVISHYDVVKGSLRIAHWNGSGFTGSVVDEGEDLFGTDGAVIADANVGMFSAIAIEGDLEYIAYYDSAQGDLLLATGNTDGYTIERVDTEGDIGQWPDIAVVEGQIHISYQDVTNQNLKYTTGTSGNWSTTTVDDSPYSGADSAISMHSGAPTIIYFDGENNDMKIARLNGESWNNETVTGDQGPLGFHNELIEIGGRHYAGCFNYHEKLVWFNTVDE